MPLRAGSSISGEKMSKSISPKPMSAYKSAVYKSMNKKIDNRKLRGFFGHKSTIKGVSHG